MTVEPTGDGRSFDVSSADDKDHYIVDIMENEGRGVCSCRDHSCRCQTKLNRGDKAIPYYKTYDRTMCKHQQQVLIYLGAMLWSRLNKKTTEELFTL